MKNACNICNEPFQYKRKIANVLSIEKNIKCNNCGTVYEIQKKYNLIFCILVLLPTIILPYILQYNPVSNQYMYIAIFIVYLIYVILILLLTALVSKFKLVKKQ